jgi:hypothetical protein
MAKKVNVLKLAQLSRGQAEVTNRCPAPVPLALYLMQPRAPQWKMLPFRRRLPVAVDADASAEIEHPVKITRLG